MRFRHLGWVGCLSLAACVTPPEEDPTYQKLVEVDGRVLRIERVINNQSLLDLSQKDDALQGELRALRGQIEELQNSVDKLRTQQRDLYADLDKRVLALESVKASAPPITSLSSQAVADSDAYQAAFNLLKDTRYSEAAVAFTAFLGNYPQSALLDNARYWLGEAHYVLKDFVQAQRDFQGVVDLHPGSAKTPDALLKLGFTQYELKNYPAARAALNKVVNQYADSNAGKLAQQRLAKMTAEGR